MPAGGSATVARQQFPVAAAVCKFEPQPGNPGQDQTAAKQSYRFHLSAGPDGFDATCSQEANRRHATKSSQLTPPVVYTHPQPAENHECTYYGR
jgi:hypothetical protein